MALSERSQIFAFYVVSYLIQILCLGWVFNRYKAASKLDFHSEINPCRKPWKGLLTSCNILWWQTQAINQFTCAFTWKRSYISQMMFAKCFLSLFIYSHNRFKLFLKASSVVKFGCGRLKIIVKHAFEIINIWNSDTSLAIGQQMFYIKLSEFFLLKSENHMSEVQF